MFNISRRTSLIASVAALLEASAFAKTPRRAIGDPSVWTLEEERAAAKQAARLVAEETGEQPHPAAGESLHFNQTLQLIDAQQWDENSAQKKLLLVFFWASWCPICKALAPKLQRFWLAHRHQGLQLLTVSADANRSITQATAKKLGFRFPIVMASTLKLDPVFQIRSFPTLMIRSQRGTIVTVEEGDLSAEELRELLVHL